MVTDTNQIDEQVRADMRRRDRRLLSGLIDVGLIPSLVVGWTDTAAAPDLSRGLTIVVLAIVYVLLETTTGRSPGKYLVDLVVTGTDGGRVSFRSAAVRRLWMVVWALGYAVGNGLGEVGAFVVVISIIWTMARGDDLRGWHDDLADTMVVPAPTAASWPAKAAVIVVIALLTLALNLAA